MSRKELFTLLIAMIFCVLVLYIIMYPNEAYKAAFDGVTLWFNIVFPALLPFFICVEILIGLGIVSFVGSCFKAVMRPLFKLPGEASFAFFMSIASGYPVGAKITASLLQSKVCTRVEAQRMLSLCSTSGPLFIIGAVSTGILKNPKLGLLLALSHYLSALVCGLLMSFYGREKRSSDSPKIKITEYSKRSNPLSDLLEYRKKDGRSLGTLMGDAVKNSMLLILMIGGFIILFSVITAMLRISGVMDLISKLLCTVFFFLHLNPDAVSSVIVGMLEMTNGINQCAALDLSVIDKLMMVSFMIGFGGLSINAQVMSVISGSNLKVGLYTFIKLIQGIVAAVIIYILYIPMQARQVFNLYDSLNIGYYVRYMNSSMSSRLLDSTLNLFIVLGAMLIFILITYKKRAKA